MRFNGEWKTVPATVFRQPSNWTDKGDFNHDGIEDFIAIVYDRYTKEFNNNSAPEECRYTMGSAISIPYKILYSLSDKKNKKRINKINKNFFINTAYIFFENFKKTKDGFLMKFGISQSTSVPLEVYFIVKNNRLYVTKGVEYDKETYEIPSTKKINKYIEDVHISDTWQ